MISTAIQSVLVGIIPNTYLAMGDENIVVPYCVHKERGTPQYLKAGISGYSYECEIVIIDDLPEAIETLSVSIKTALEALVGTTSSNTKIESVVFEGDEPDYDTESKLYLTVMRFTIETSNR